MIKVRQRKNPECVHTAVSVKVILIGSIGWNKKVWNILSLPTPLRII